tara:strand:+ start:580 stop:744 length:165 start_codon:yes stop_codon:yes gene_type:complete
LNICLKFERFVRLYSPFGYADHPHRHRYYFFDHDANEYEFVQYLSEDPSERNEY